MPFLSFPVRLFARNGYLCAWPPAPSSLGRHSREQPTSFEQLAFGFPSSLGRCRRHDRTSRGGLWDYAEPPRHALSSMLGHNIDMGSPCPQLNIRRRVCCRTQFGRARIRSCVSLLSFSLSWCHLNAHFHTLNHFCTLSAPICGLPFVDQLLIACLLPPLPFVRARSPAYQATRLFLLVRPPGNIDRRLPALALAHCGRV